MNNLETFCLDQIVVEAIVIRVLGIRTFLELNGVIVFFSIVIVSTAIVE